jgi:hypothetical protein
MDAADEKIGKIKQILKRLIVEMDELGDLLSVDDRTIIPTKEDDLNIVDQLEGIINSSLGQQEK